jgi:hypothetical protein
VVTLLVWAKRLLQEPTTLFYFCVIVIKVLPHVALMLGFKQQFLRWVPRSLVVGGLALLLWRHRDQRAATYVAQVWGCKQQFSEVGCGTARVV